MAHVAGAVLLAVAHGTYEDRVNDALVHGGNGAGDHKRDEEGRDRRPHGIDGIRRRVARIRKEVAGSGGGIGEGGGSDPDADSEWHAIEPSREKVVLHEAEGEESTSEGDECGLHSEEEGLHEAVDCSLRGGSGGVGSGGVRSGGVRSGEWRGGEW